MIVVFIISETVAFSNAGETTHKGGLSELTPSSGLDFSVILASHASCVPCPLLPLAQVVTLHGLGKNA